jgi:hypothetical protein
MTGTKVHELLRDERTWGKGCSAMDVHYDGVEPDDPSATQWCLAGAIERCYPGEEGEIMGQIARYLEGAGLIREDADRDDWHALVTAYNDDDSTTFADIHSLVTTLDI